MKPKMTKRATTRGNSRPFGIRGIVAKAYPRNHRPGKEVSG
jgi:hypothetical protein